MKDETLAKSISYLPLDQIDRIQLWLTYKQIKPASTILLPNSTKDPGEVKLSRIVNWITKAGLKHINDSQNTRLLHVSTSKNSVEVLNRLQWSEKEKDITKRGVLYGYPEKAVRSFAKGWVTKSLKHLMADKEEIAQVTKNKYWKNYLVYATRKNHIIDDSKVAIKWADEIRASIPKLAKWYEK